MIWILFSAFIAWAIIFLVLDFFIRDPKTDLDIVEKNLSLSIVIVMRNEANNISNCLASIDSQIWLPREVEVFVVDDHSTDDSMKIVKQFKPEKFNLNTLELSNVEGKKAGLKLATECLKTDRIYFTDADCSLNSNTIRYLWNGMDDKSKVVIGPVILKGSGFWKHLLCAENLNNQMVTKAFVNMRTPIMANGANLMIDKSCLEQYRQSLESKVASGDDVFFVQKMRGSCNHVMHHESSVMTDTPSSVSAFVNQRLRWAAKTSKYSSMVSKAFAILVFSINLIFVLFMVLLPFVDGKFWVLLFILMKALLEYAFHRSWFMKYNFKHRLVPAIVLSIVYPIYVVAIGVLSNIGMGFHWKERKHIR